MNTDKIPKSNIQTPVLEIPKSKLQASEKLQMPNSNPWLLVLGYSLEFGCWILELLTSPLRYPCPSVVENAFANSSFFGTQHCPDLTQRRKGAETQREKYNSSFMAKFKVR